MISLRPTVAADHSAIADLNNRVNPWSPASAEMIAHFGRTVDPHRPYAEVVADSQHEPIGFGVLAGWPGNPAMTMIVAVDEVHRRRGIGTSLFEWLSNHLDAPRLVGCKVSEECAAGIAFATRFGFEERTRVFPSVLDLTRFAPGRFAGYQQTAEAAGLRFTTFAAVDTMVMRHRIHDLQNACHADVPTAERLQPITFEEWEEANLEAPWFRAELLALALQRERPVALSYIAIGPDGEGVNAFTGVATDYRGHGLGTAIKVEALRLAKDAGLQEVSTDNHTDNAPILAVNERLGYARRPGIIGFMATLAPIDSTMTTGALQGA